MIVQETVTKIWNDLKQEFKSDSEQFELTIQNNIESLNQNITQNKVRNLIFFTSLKKPVSSVKDYPTASTSNEDLPKPKIASTEEISPRHEDQIRSSKMATPAQDESKKIISAMESSLNLLPLQRDSGLSIPGLDKEIQKLRAKIETEKKIS
ncbi:hypothetical protein KQX54_001450 [Cotesia glomerata]|uniref:Uncharacterized protein n=1 Tax=Cotesia glomerata TaxID=32391 RepID=A0AAV7J179_COTGL|nr:hypothetical protein KQX54_001450 [Cotesia glomerata]